MLTQGGGRNLDEQTFHRVLSAVRNFDVFTPDNDPWKEHDFGMVMDSDVKGVSLRITPCLYCIKMVPKTGLSKYVMITIN